MKEDRLSVHRGHDIMESTCGVRLLMDGWSYRWRDGRNGQRRFMFDIARLGLHVSVEQHSPCGDIEARIAWWLRGHRLFIWTGGHDFDAHEHWADEVREAVMYRPEVHYRHVHGKRRTGMPGIGDCQPTCRQCIEWLRTGHDILGWTEAQYETRPR